jgi:hypothetical protein
MKEGLPGDPLRRVIEERARSAPRRHCHRLHRRAGVTGGVEARDRALSAGVGLDASDLGQGCAERNRQIACERQVRPNEQRVPGQRGPARGELDAELATTFLNSPDLIVDELDTGSVEAIRCSGAISESRSQRSTTSSLSALRSSAWCTAFSPQPYTVIGRSRTSQP